jgi:radical SAM protein with 4Fe4S-binding SPASM domain
LYLEPEDIAALAETYALEIQDRFPFSVRLALPPALYHPNSHLSEAMCTGCDVGAIIGVLHDGTIRPCHNFMYSDAHNFGSIYEDYDLEAIAHSIRHLPGRNQFDIGGICGDCLMLAKCRGFCRAQAQNEYGTTAAPNRLCQDLHEMGQFPEAMRLSNAFGGDRYAGTMTRVAKKIRVIPLSSKASPLT